MLKRGHPGVIYYFRSSQAVVGHNTHFGRFALEADLVMQLSPKCRIYEFQLNVSEAPPHMPDSLKPFTTFLPWALGPPGSSALSRRTSGQEAHSLQEIRHALGHDHTAITALIIDSQASAAALVALCLLVAMHGTLSRCQLTSTMLLFLDIIVGVSINLWKFATQLNASLICLI
eukprot:scaffold98175_cov30-Prasinocladus_malaysianus.AAC.1